VKTITKKPANGAPKNYASWPGRLISYQKALAFIIIGSIGLVSAYASFATPNSPDAKTRGYIENGFRPAGCNVVQPGRHHCNIELPVDKHGNPLHAKTWGEAKKLRHTAAAQTSPAPTDIYTPQQFHVAYQLPCKPGGPVQGTCPKPSSFGPQTIAIVDPGGYQGVGSIESNLATFDQQYGLPACTVADGCLKIVNQQGQTSPLPAPLPSNDNWDPEFDLDVQTAHSICQTCKITVVEADTDGEALNQAVATAALLNPTAINLSWGGANEPADNSYFQYKGIAVVAASGDSGSDEANGYPGDLADVISVAGTTLNLNTDNSWKSETVWPYSGGGCALTGFNAPSWQTGLPNWTAAGCGNTKADADVSADANPLPGVAEYSDGQWSYAGGTSLSAPIVAASIAMAGGVPSSESGPQYAYQNANSSNTRDITSGNNCTATVTKHCKAAVGFDEPTGLGSPNGMGMFGNSGTTTSGDLNGDGKTNITDLSILLTNWAKTGAARAQGDLNGDGTVNITDLSMLLTTWTG
jgi:subtilase family serine protease